MKNPGAPYVTILQRKMTHQTFLKSFSASERAELLEAYRGESIRLAMKIVGNSAAAEDIVQTAFIKLIQANSIPILIPELLKFTRRTVTNCAIDHLRRSRFENQLPESIPHTENQHLDFEINQTLGLLSPEHRVILALHLGEGYSYREISDTLQIPMGTVASRLNQARSEFRRLWEDSL